MSDQRPHRNGDITADQVTQAIVQLMRGPNGDGHVDPALAATLAGQVLPTVQKQFAGRSSAQLGTEPAFRSLVSLHIATTAETDPNVIRFNAMRHNITSADHAAAERAGLHGGSAHGRFSALVTGVSVERGAGMPELAATNGNLTVEQARNMAAARAMANELGMSWAANHPDLLKLGPAAIKAIADTNLRETGYKALRNGAYYDAPDIVAFAKHSKLRGFDAEKAAKSTEVLVQSLPPGEQKATADVLKGYDHAAAAHYANPNDVAARARFEAAGKAQKQRMEDIAKRSDADRQRVQRLEDDKRVEQRFRATTIGNEHTATVKGRNADLAEAKGDAAKTAALEGLDDPSPDTSATRHAGGPAAEQGTGRITQAQEGTAPLSGDGKPIVVAAITPEAPIKQPGQDAGQVDDKTKPPISNTGNTQTAALADDKTPTHRAVPSTPKMA